jgi:hypothetical protein
VLRVNNDDGDLQLHFSVTGGSWSYQDVNEWNKKRRLSRAFLDDNGDPVLEAGLLSHGGVTTDRVRAFIDIHVGSSLIGFERFSLEHTHLLEHNGSDSSGLGREHTGARLVPVGSSAKPSFIRPRAPSM